MDCVVKAIIWPTNMFIPSILPDWSTANICKWFSIIEAISLNWATNITWTAWINKKWLSLYEPKTEFDMSVTYHCIYLILQEQSYWRVWYPGMSHYIVCFDTCASELAICPQYFGHFIIVLVSRYFTSSAWWWLGIGNRRKQICFKLVIVKNDIFLSCYICNMNKHFYINISKEYSGCHICNIINRFLLTPSILYFHVI